MPTRLIRWSIENRLLVVIATLILAGWGWLSVKQIPLDAIPDLSDVQVIIRTEFAGQAPQVVEQQVTYPITTTMLAVPGASAVRGYSFFGDSYVYVIFEDGTDLYWARSRVLEYLNQAAANLPAGVQPRLGPDATGVGLDLQLCAGGPQRRPRPVRVAQHPGLVSEIRTADGSRRGRGGDRRRHGAPVPGGGEPGEAARFRHSPVRRDRGDPPRQPGGGRLGDRAGRGGIHDPHPRLSGFHRGHRGGAAGRDRGRYPDPAARRRPGPGGPGDAPGGRRSRRRRRGDRRHRGHALRRERAGYHRRGQGAHGGAQAGAARGRGDRRDLRPLGADPARGGQPLRPADRGVHRRRPGLPAVPVPPALGLRRHRHPAARHTGGLPGHALPGHQRQYHVPGRHRHRHRRHGGCRRGDDRKRPQAPGAGGPRAQPGSNTGR